MLKMGFNLDPLVPFSPNPCLIPQKESSISNGYSNSHLNIAQKSENNGGRDEIPQKESSISNGYSNSLFNIAKKSENNGDRDEEQSEFWKQLDRLGYGPCLDFSNEYRKSSVEIVKDRRNCCRSVTTLAMDPRLPSQRFNESYFAAADNEEHYTTVDFAATDDEEHASNSMSFRPVNLYRKTSISKSP
ncbi:hypothetical protein F0562_031679 [Nyssa sinensis]|uniref:Uncharacterized protein n=1 Tax=Nyssa sinensis TaxID=561372 RepID=A0A5J5AV33_9ASTE|nr:hypothetical protein F0562_031679 [Nyssa sinensis]